MSKLIQAMFQGYNYLFVDVANPHIKDWFLMSSPFPGLAIIGLYLWLIKDYGPKFMQNRQPYKLDRLIQVYNIIQVFLSFYTFYKFMEHGWGGRYNWKCATVLYELDDPDEYAVASMTHLYFVTKIIDLLDTIFFTLRKKYNQISFLHLYHHAGMVALGWGAVKWFTTGHATMLMTVNSFVHTILYGYYFLTSVSSQYSNTWWKKYITKIQLAQFLFLTCHFGQVVFSNPCKFPSAGLAIVIPQNLFIFTLFADFYYHTYIKKKPEKKEKAS